MSLEKLWALQIVDEAGDLLALTVTNEKGIQKSIENQDLWTLHPETDRLIPWQEGVSLVSLMAHKDGYQAVVRGGEASTAQEASTAGATLVSGETTLEKLQQVIALRNHERPEGSYTTHLFENGVEKILKKTGEEAVEMLLARTDGELLYESADFLYHLFVLLEAKGLDYRDILQELEKTDEMMKKPYLERLQEGVLLFDGAMGTYLYTKGIYLKKCFEEVCLSKPQLVLDTHLEYLQAGAQALETNTYGANPIKLRSYNLAHKTEAINQKAVALAKEAAAIVEGQTGVGIYIAGAVGPTGQKLEPEGSLSPVDARRSFEAHIGALIRAGVDILLLETFTDRTELEIAIAVVRELAPEIPLQVQFTASHTLLSDQTYFAQQALDWGRYFQEQAAIDVAGGQPHGA